MEQFSDFTMFGIYLVPFIVGIVSLLRNETNLSDYVLDWLGAVLFALAGVVSLELVELVLTGQQPGSVLLTAPVLMQLVTVFVGVLLTVKGYWPTVRSRMTDTYSSVVRGVFFSKY